MNKRLLVVEDSEDLRRILEKIFAAHGYFVQTAANGQEALERLRQQQELPCVILLDLMMPVMDGYEFQRNLSLDQRIANVPVIVMTAHASRQEGLALGAKEYIRKPADLDMLVNTVARYC